MFLDLAIKDENFLGVLTKGMGVDVQLIAHYRNPCILYCNYTNERRPLPHLRQLLKTTDTH